MVVLRTIALLLHLDETGIYFDNSVLITLAVAISVAFAVFALSYAFVAEKELSLAASFENPQTYIPSGLVAVALFFMGTSLFGEMYLSWDGIFSKNLFSSFPSILLLTISVLSFICAANFFLNAFYEKRESQSRAAFCLCCAVFLAFYAGYLFFNENLPINAPNKALDQMAHLALAIFFLYETRISLGRPIWKLYTSFGLIAANLAFFSSVPSIICYFVEGKVVSASIAENVLVLTLGIYTTSRLALTATLVPDVTCDTAKAIAEMARRRAEEIENAEKLRMQNDANEEKFPEATPTTAEGSNYEMEIPTFMTDDGESPFQQGFNFDEGKKE